MDDQQVGAAMRAVRIKRRWRQADVSARAGVDASLISRLERGHLDRLSLVSLRRIAATLDIRLEVWARWRGGELDRMVNARHSELHEVVARFLQAVGWQPAPEVSFSIYGERGVIDIFAWHAASGSLLVIELKTAIVDVQELVGTLDRKVRLAPRIAAERGWHARTVSAWVVVATGRTNRRRIAAHRTMLRAAYPTDGRGIRAWLRRPREPVRALSIWPDLAPGHVRPRLSPVRRVRTTGHGPI
ncbi:MAG TPA: XRE family transcriptional regulator [Candidatus Limnocylindrales bacterium]